MQPLSQQIADMVKQLPEQEQQLVYELVKRLVPDDVASPSDIEAIRLAREEFRKGETVDHNSINWG